MTVNQRIFHYRKLAGLTQAEVADQMGLKLNTYSKMEREGKITVDKLIKLAQILDVDYDLLVNALVGYAGLVPTARAIEAHKRIALANKETLVVGGATIMPMAIANKAPILPIDSEHSAIFQCLMGEHSPLRRLIITCSGGALRDVAKADLKNVLQLLI